MGLKDSVSDEVDTCSGNSKVLLSTRPLYFWLKSFAGREIEDDAEFSTYVSSNALNYALEYIGITPEAEQSSLHLSAIFDEDSQKQNKYPTHYESETKSRIQYLNRIFIELKSFFEDRFSQLVAIPPPNTVHITASCGGCSVQEFEKLLFLLLGAAIQGPQKQDLLSSIRRFPTKVQESLIECVKLIADNPELLNVKSWNEFHQTLGADEQKKVYESLLILVRKLILERNELTQNQLILDYFAGYTSCEQKRGFNVFAEGCEDTRLSSSMRQLKEQLTEKSELLLECREELEKARNRILDLEIEVNEMKQKHRAMKKARDELDALREGQDKAVRLEAELARLKSRMEESELVYERVENLEIENRSWQVKHDMLLDQISFLSFEKSSRDNSFDQMNAYTGILDGLTENIKDFKDDRTFFDSDDDEQSVREKVKVNPEPSESLEESQLQPQEQKENDLVRVVGEPITSPVPQSQAEIDHAMMNTSSSTIQPDSSPEKEEIIERPIDLDISQTESIDNSGDNLVASTPTQKACAEFKTQEVQTPTLQSRVKRRRRSSLLNLKRTRKAIIIPIPQGQKMPIPQIEDDEGEDSQIKNPNTTTSHTIQFYKVYSVDRKKGSSRPKKFKSPTKNPTSIQKASSVVPNLDSNENENGGNDADEELSISPTGNPNLSDLDSNNDPQNGTDNESELYFVCSPPTSTGANTPKRTSNFGTTTAFPISNNGLRRTEFAFDPHNLSDIHYNLNLQNPSHHSNHLTIYSNRPTNLTPSPTGSGGSNREITTTKNTNTSTHSLNHVPYTRPRPNPPPYEAINSGVPRPRPNSNSDDQDNVDGYDDDDGFTYGGYDIQLNLRNSIKPSTALINKISTLSSNLNSSHPDHNHNTYSSVHPREINYIVETSSEEDASSIWYEYGCV